MNGESSFSQQQPYNKAKENETNKTFSKFPQTRCAAGNKVKTLGSFSRTRVREDRKRRVLVLQKRIRPEFGLFFLATIYLVKNLFLKKQSSWQNGSLNSDLVRRSQTDWELTLVVQTQCCSDVVTIATENPIFTSKQFRHSGITPGGRGWLFSQLPPGGARRHWVSLCPERRDRRRNSPDSREAFKVVKRRRRTRRRGGWGGGGLHSHTYT